MFTKQWYTALASNAMRQSLEYKGRDGGTYTTTYSYCGVLVGLLNEANSMEYPTMPFLRKEYKYTGVYLGTGSKAPSIDDYCLAGDLITTYNYSYEISTSYEDGVATISVVYAITNTGSSDFTIAEVGMFAGPMSGATTAQFALVERTVLDAPLTIVAGGVGYLTYTIEINMPI